MSLMPDSDRSAARPVALCSATVDVQAVLCFARHDCNVSIIHPTPDADYLMDDLEAGSNLHRPLNIGAPNGHRKGHAI